MIDSMAPQWTIELLTSPDGIDEILAVEQSSFTNPWTREMYLAEFDHPGMSFLYVARDARRHVIGFCSFWRVLDEFHINNLAVDPTWRRVGVARALLTHVLSEGVRMGAHRATLEVRRSNEAAQKLYANFGFSVAGVRRDYYTNPVEDALVLWRERLNDG